ncbi:protein SSUH2 homolog isoform X2 [Anolis sagrei]|uniref:protein SSUH2 homolog isoform X2 n=1 Tax=Anolis sagrei TaxID=38937 RepID=UPI00352288F9
MAEGRQVNCGPVFQNYGTVVQVPVPSTVGPLTPFLAGMGSLPGYEGIGIQDQARKHFPLPPNLVPIQGDQPCLQQTDWKIPAISEDDAKEAFVQYASSKCCYSKAPAIEMSLQDLQTFNTYRYRLETFTESRSAVWKAEPYNGGVVDSFLHGVAPLPWDVVTSVPPMFKDYTIKLKVPHTSAVKACPTCGTCGRCPCQKCKGGSKCWACNGKGYRINDETCSRCTGTGTDMCKDCSGMGTKECPDCKGRGQLLVFIELIIEWKNNISKHVSDPNIGFPTKLFDEVNGVKLFEDEQLMVTPVLGFPDHVIMKASRDAVEGHRFQFGSTRRILRQRQTIELILLSKVEYEWHGHSHSYYVYGNERKVYAKDYPKTCCCTII